MNEREILAYLERDRTIRIDMIEAIRRKTATVLYAEPDYQHFSKDVKGVTP